MIRIKELRTEKELSLRDLSKVLDISYSSLGKYERGEQQPSFETLSKIANYFNVSIDYLLGNSDGRIISDQELYDRLGLTDEAICSLEHLSNLSKENKHNKKLLENVNALLSDFESLNAISDYLNSSMEEYQYAVIKSYVSQFGEDLLEKPDSKEQVLSAEQWGNFMMLNVQDALMKLRESFKDKQ